MHKILITLLILIICKVSLIAQICLSSNANNISYNSKVIINKNFYKILNFNSEQPFCSNLMQINTSNTLAVANYKKNYFYFKICNSNIHNSNQVLENSIFTDSLEITVLQENSKESFQMGLAFPFNSKKNNMRKNILFLDFKPHECKEILFSYYGRFSEPRESFYISPFKEFVEKEENINFYWGLYFCIILLIVGFSTIIWILFYRNVVLINFILYTVFIFLTICDGNNFTFKYIFPNNPEIEKLFSTVIILGAYIYLLKLTSTFFNYNLFRRLIQILFLIGLINLILISFVNSSNTFLYKVVWNSTFWVVIICCVLSFIVPILKFNANKLKSSIFILGNFIMTFAGIYTAIQFKFGFKLNEFSNFYPPIAHTIESLAFLSLSLLEVYTTFRIKNKLQLDLIENENKKLNLESIAQQLELDRAQEQIKFQIEREAHEQSLNSERSRIASEMHDDLGSGLTTIRYLSNKALKNADSTEEGEQIRKISDQSNELIQNMSEIIWAMNSRNDTIEMLCSYMRRYSSEYLDQYKIQLNWNQNVEDANSVVTGEKRRAIFLVLKEALHNVVKHSKASQVSIKIDNILKKLVVEIHDNGIGFDTNNSNASGNGIYNMKKRIESVQGEIKIITTSEGTSILIECEL